jgi:hypothetical protein
MDKMGFKTPEEAKQDRAEFFKNVIAPNLAEGGKASDDWAKKTVGAVIAPAEFEKTRGLKETKWGQDAFMGMWLGVIDNQVTEMVMLDGWQYSDGAGEEYLQAMLMKMGRRARNNIEVLDSAGNEMKFEDGIKLMADAFKEIHNRGLKPRNMAATLLRLIEAEYRYSVEQDYGQSAEPTKESYAVYPNMPAYDRKKMLPAAKEARRIIHDHYPDVEEIVEKNTSFAYAPINALFRKVEKLPENVALDNLKKDAPKPDAPNAKPPPAPPKTPIP